MVEGGRPSHTTLALSTHLIALCRWSKAAGRREPLSSLWRYSTRSRRVQWNICHERRPSAAAERTRNTGSQTRHSASVNSNPGTPLTWHGVCDAINMDMLQGHTQKVFFNPTINRNSCSFVTIGVERMIQSTGA